MEKLIDGVVHVAVMDAAQEMETTHLRLLMMVKNGELAGINEDGEWWISRPSLESLKSCGVKIAAPDSCKTSCKSSSCGCM